MESDPFSILSFELIFAILTCFDSPRDLISALRASPALYGTFLNGRPRILLQVAKNGFEPAVLSPAVIAVRYSMTSVAKEDACGNPDHAVNERFRLLGQLLNGAARKPKLTEGVGLCRLLSAIEAFTLDSCSYFVPHLQWTTSPESARRPFAPHATPSSAGQALTDTEIGRLQRGYVHYYTFQTLISQLPPGRRLWKWEIANLFTKLPPWKVDETDHLHAYFSARLTTLQESVSEDALETITNTDDPDAAITAYKHRTGLDPAPLLAPYPLTILRHLLPTLRNHQGYIHDDISARPDIFTGAMDEYAAHQQHPPDTFGDTERSNQRLYFEGDHLDKPSRGHVWRMHGQSWRTLRFSSADNQDMAWGRVFWDQGRLDGLGLLPPAVNLWYSDYVPGASSL